jgi:hypothetical protein
MTPTDGTRVKHRGSLPHPPWEHGIDYVFANAGTDFARS